VQKLPYILILAIILISCNEKIDTQAEIDKLLTQKLDKHKSDELEKCKKDAFQQAEDYVDDVIASWISKELIDTIFVPKKPLKPKVPDHILGTIKNFEKK